MEVLRLIIWPARLAERYITPPMNCQLPVTSSTLRSSHQHISIMPSSPSAIRRSPTPPPQPSQLSYMAFTDTTIV
uniref:Secreted protein n=1 Tax=Meloidogyne hapla TaxID=6305 RepID=A0A1I8BCZ1_MELHA